ncbi:DedA family protein [Sneathiella sp. CAU 1612]|uniref:DedA family protein n=1 Tax=Sneathiella sedimenti TaxID=2816034 RepID=A0ABS3F9Z1_9PROT|nr:YqaA family protein [Sneathiella sedimenti]MBO0334752.1 DedA family protein [Sneathiella sedimenti]
MTAAVAYASLFVSAFLSATLFPGTSEAAFALLLSDGIGAPVWLFVAAVAGNVLGSVVNWFLGRFFAKFRDRRWFPIKEIHYARAVRWFDTYGKWSLLLAWAPIIGDPLTIVAGALRVHFGFFLLLVTLGKSARYLFILQAALIWMG